MKDIFSHPWVIGFEKKIDGKAFIASIENQKKENLPSEVVEKKLEKLNTKGNKVILLNCRV